MKIFTDPQGYVHFIVGIIAGLLLLLYFTLNSILYLAFSILIICTFIFYEITEFLIKRDVLIKEIIEFTLGFLLSSSVFGIYYSLSIILKFFVIHLV